MSAELGGAAAAGQPAAKSPQAAGPSMITQLYDEYAAHLFDYCA